MSFSSYPDYRNSGVEWLGVVPTYWESWKISHAFEELGSGTTPPTSETEWYEGGTVPWVTTGELRESVIWETKKLLSAAALSKFSALRLHPAGSLAIAMYGATIGRLGILGIDAVTNQACCLLTRPNHLHVKFTFYWLLVFKQSIIELYASGGGQPNINQEIIANLKVPAPGVQEQAQIARFLDYETARIDALIEEQHRLIELLKEKRQAVISHAVTKGLDHTVPMKDSRVEWLGEVPAHWVCKSYRYASVIYRGKFSHRPRNDPALYDGEFAFIQTGDIARADKYIRNYKQTLNRKGVSVSQKFPAETLVMAIAANVGDTAILGFEAYAPDSVVGFKPEKDIELEFLRFSLIAALPELKKTSTQSTQSNLNIDRISGIQSVFPPLTEQVEISDHLNGLMERFSLLENQAVASIELMNERRSALISAAVTGKIDVRGWKPTARDLTRELAEEAV